MHKIAIIQPALPHYRHDFFSRLGKHFNLLVVHSSAKIFRENQENYEELCVKEINIFGIFFFQFIPFIKLFRKNDIVIINGNIRYLSNLLILLLGIFFNKKIFWWGHLVSANGNAFWIYIRIWLSKMATARFFYTEHESCLAICKYKAPKSTTHFMSNGLDIEHIKSLRKIYNPRYRQIDVLFCGRFTTKAKIGELLLSLEKIKKSLNVLLVGDVGGVLEKNAEFNIHHHKLNIVALTTDESKLSSYFNDAKLFVYPGAAGLSIIHAASYGVPILVSNNWSSHMPEISVVRDYAAGHTFEHGDTLDMANQIEKCLVDFETLAILSSCGKEAADRMFNTQVMVNNIKHVIDK